jgi:hypothetical protein|tara:strand:+ start:41 stop:457 length:417 start_codon:yes stop_codon:yes gene_type:complete
MIEKFNNVFFLIIFFAHFVIVGSYAFQLVFDTKKFLKGRGVDKTATLITRFAGSFMIAIVIMAIYIAFIRSGGIEATWAFFNLVFIINVSILIVNFYSLRIDKTGLTKKTKDDGIYAPLILVIMSAILCYGLADKIYV